ncbi:alpha/beta fold hydrolase [Streptomyces sp. NPDC006487]|uniref:alpha/beta fold hydrolase n=1 Tax=Streptomyces sp. NPDC006487 TaxID=3364748 RepID=UPI00367ED405
MNGRTEVGVRLRRPAEGAGKPVRVLTLHGLAGTTEVWRRFSELADPRLEVWEAELPWAASAVGTGWSHRPDPVPWVRQALDGVPGGADAVVAHSFAAGAVLELLAAEGPARPGAVVLVSPFHRRDPDDFDFETAQYYLNGFHRILDEGLRVSSADRIPGDLRELMALKMRERVGPYGWMRFFDAYLRSPFLDVGSLTRPVLVVAGEHDFAAPPSDARALAEALPHAEVRVFDDSGHFPMAEQPELFAATVNAFLTGSRPRAAVSEPARTATGAALPALPAPPS